MTEFDMMSESEKQRVWIDEFRAFEIQRADACSDISEEPAHEQPKMIRQLRIWTEKRLRLIDFLYPGFRDYLDQQQIWAR